MADNNNVIQLPDQSPSQQDQSGLLTKPSKDERIELLSGSALRRFTYELDITDDILKTNVSNGGESAVERSENLKKIGQPLSARERKVAEQTVDRFLEDLNIAAKDVTEQLNQELAAANIELPDPKKRYPLSQEERYAGTSWIARRAKPIREKFNEHLRPLAENPLQLSYAFEYLSWRGREPIDEILGAALLPRLISAFEQYVGALLRTGLTFYPQGLGPYGDVPFELTTRYPDLQDIHRYMIDKKIGTFLSGSPEDWARQISKWPGIELQSLAWDRIREAVQRRHVLIHKGGIVDEDYLSRLPKDLAAGSLGDRLRCDANYMTEVLISLRYCAISAGLQLAWKLGKVPPNKTYPVLLEDIVGFFERQSLWREAQELTELALSMKIEDVSEADLIRVNRWLAIQQQGHAADTIAEIKAWDPDRKSRQVARAALLRDYDECIRLLKETLKGPRVVQQRRWYKEQPLMQRAMSEEPKIGRLLGNIAKAPRSSKHKR